MPKKPSYLYPMLAFALFFMVISAVLVIPTVRLQVNSLASGIPAESLIDQERPLVVWGENSFTVGDAIMIFSLLAASVDVATLLILLRRHNTK